LIKEKQEKLTVSFLLSVSARHQSGAVGVSVDLGSPACLQTDAARPCR